MVPLLLLALGLSLGLSLTAAAPWTDQDQEQLDVGEQRSMARDCNVEKELEPGKKIGWWGGGLGTFVYFSSHLNHCIQIYLISHNFEYIISRTIWTVIYVGPEICFIRTIYLIDPA